MNLFIFNEKLVTMEMSSFMIAMEMSLIFHYNQDNQKIIATQLINSFLIIILNNN